ncbi:hypothetical protein BJV74DRAFT_988670 [Russula compacta]|nr:hypothetical protein BJV74DRAFT_988670 [Russula compacta]
MCRCCEWEAQVLVGLREKEMAKSTEGRKWMTRAFTNDLGKWGGVMCQELAHGNGKDKGKEGNPRFVPICAMCSDHDETFSLDVRDCSRTHQPLLTSADCILYCTLGLTKGHAIRPALAGVYMPAPTCLHLPACTRGYPGTVFKTCAILYTGCPLSSQMLCHLLMGFRLPPPQI